MNSNSQENKEYFLSSKTCQRCYWDEEHKIFIKNDSRAGSCLYNSEQKDYLKNICNHQFTDQDINSLNFSMDELKEELRILRKLARNMVKVKINIIRKNNESNSI